MTAFTVGAPRENDLPTTPAGPAGDAAMIATENVTALAQRVAAARREKAALDEYVRAELRRAAADPLHPWHDADDAHPFDERGRARRAA